MFAKTLAASASIALVAGNADSVRRNLNTISLSSMRNLGTTVIGTMLDNYGCWCKFEVGQQNYAKGMPQDDFDKLCQAYHAGAQCAILDDPTCEPFSQDYNDVFNQNNLFSDVELRVQCAIANPTSSCAVRTCEIETKFIQESFELLQIGVIPDVAQFGIANGFDSAAKCPGWVGTQQDKQCCGTSPNRYPYDAAIKECCAYSGLAYFAGIEDCCADGSIAPTGQC